MTELTQGTSEAERPLRRDAQRNRELLIAAAREVFAERGLCATLDDVAERAGVGVGTAYRRFPNKEALIEEVFESRLQGVLEVIDRAEQEERAYDGLVLFMESMLQWQVEDRGFKEAYERTEEGRDRISAAKARILPRASALLERAQEQGDVRPDLAPTDLPLISIMIGGVIDVTRDVSPETWRRCLSLVLDSLPPTREGCAGLGAPLSQDQFDRSIEENLPKP